jgi:hypothetical protein
MRVAHCATCRGYGPRPDRPLWVVSERPGPASGGTRSRSPSRRGLINQLTVILVGTRISPAVDSSTDACLSGNPIRESNDSWFARMAREVRREKPEARRAELADFHEGARLQFVGNEHVAAYCDTLSADRRLDRVEFFREGEPVGFLRFVDGDACSAHRHCPGPPGRRRWLILPPVHAALRAFEAAARHMSFQAAATELAVTLTAISHQIRDLETACGPSAERGAFTCQRYEARPGRTQRLPRLSASNWGVTSG